MGQIAWQVFTALTYGAKGILYFYNWPDPGRPLSLSRPLSLCVYVRASLLLQLARSSLPPFVRARARARARVCVCSLLQPALPRPEGLRLRGRLDRPQGASDGGGRLGRLDSRCRLRTRSVHYCIIYTGDSYVRNCM